MTTKFPAALSLALLAISGCAVRPQPVLQTTAIDYGDPPANYAAAVHRYFDSTLKDPASAQYREITEPEKGSVLSSQFFGAHAHTYYGWIVKATINAKNSYGGYVGFRSHTFLFRGEVIIDHLEPASE